MMAIHILWTISHISYRLVRLLGHPEHSTVLCVLHMRRQLAEGIVLSLQRMRVDTFVNP